MDAVTPQQIQRKRNKFARQEYEKLEKLRDKFLKEGKDMKAKTVEKIIYDKFGIGESDEVFGYGAEKE